MDQKKIKIHNALIIYISIFGYLLAGCNTNVNSDSENLENFSAPELTFCKDCNTKKEVLEFENKLGSILHPMSCEDIYLFKERYTQEAITKAEFACNNSSTKGEILFFEREDYDSGIHHWVVYDFSWRKLRYKHDQLSHIELIWFGNSTLLPKYESTSDTQFPWYDKNMLFLKNYLVEKGTTCLGKDKHGKSRLRMNINGVHGYIDVSNIRNLTQVSEEFLSSSFFGGCTDYVISISPDIGIPMKWRYRENGILRKDDYYIENGDLTLTLSYGLNPNMDSTEVCVCEFSND